jgi:hypothetical protein
MRVLIVGDFSSAGDFLRQGFEQVGVEVTHVAYQNGWRKNPLQINLTSKYSGLIGRIHNYVKPFELRKLKGFDAVIFLDYFPFPRTFGINTFMTKMLQDNNKKSYLWVTGCDSRMREWGKVNNRLLCDPCLKYDLKSSSCFCEKNKSDENNFLEGIEKIIPACFEYYQAHSDNRKLTHMVQLPVVAEERFVSSPNREFPIKFFHGLNRYGFKGTFMVEEMFALKQEQYKEKAEFLIKGKMPFNEYTTLIQKQHVVVDQLFNRSMGINSLLSLAKGKILIAGDPAEACKLISAPLPPMVKLGNKLHNLESAIDFVVNEYQSIYNEYAEQGWNYVKEFHSPKLVANKFLKIFSQ